MLALLLFPLVALASLPPELSAFLGKAPPGFEKKFHQPARQMRKAVDAAAKGNRAAAVKILQPLSTQGEMAEHAAALLVDIYRDQREFSKSTALANRVLYEFPSSPYTELLQITINANDCDQGLLDAKKNKSSLLFRCLQKTPWREWADKSEQTEALYSLLKKNKDPLFGPFVSELIQALPSSAALRARLRKELPNADLNNFAEVARFRTKTEAPSGVNAIYPDQDLFDQGMIAVLEKRWGDANSLFAQLLKDFPQSTHLDRARYWVARTAEAQGDTEDAQKAYADILSRDPLSYYGLQSALRLKKDLGSLLVPAGDELTNTKLKGSLLPRQLLGIWRIRALIEEQLLEQGRMEAKALFQFKPGGFTFGQESGAGALLAAFLFDQAGYSLASFSHAYAALSIDPTQLNTFTLDLLYPSRFGAEFERASVVSGVHPLLLQSVSKQESAFLPRATSRANALGLMQLLLSTARELDPRLAREKLFDPEVNTALGARYLQKLLDRYQGNIALALAAYNAGGTRATAWQKRLLEYESMRKTFDVDTFIDTIPFTETRRYVGSILRNYAWYKLLNKDGPLTTVEELAFQWQRNRKENPLEKPTETSSKKTSGSAPVAVPVAPRVAPVAPPESSPAISPEEPAENPADSPETLPPETLPAEKTISPPVSPPPPIPSTQKPKATSAPTAGS